MGKRCAASYLFAVKLPEAGYAALPFSNEQYVFTEEHEPTVATYPQLLNRICHPLILSLGTRPFPLSSTIWCQLKCFCSRSVAASFVAVCWVLAATHYRLPARYKTTIDYINISPLPLVKSFPGGAFRLLLLLLLACFLFLQSFFLISFFLVLSLHPPSPPPH